MHLEVVYCFLTFVFLSLYWLLGETLERGIQNSIILASDEAMVLSAQEEFDDITPAGTYTIIRTPPP